MSLAERIQDAFSDGGYAIRGLMRPMDIVETEDISAAAVECQASPQMLINPTFVEQWAETPEKLLVVVMHELHHVLLGHTRLFPRATPVNNFVFDAVINALLCRSYLQRASMSFFTGFYRDDRFPECFLRPPQSWISQSEAGIPPALCSKKLESVQPAYRAHYSETSIDYTALRHILNQKLRPDDVLQVRLIGDHENNPAPTPDLVFEAVRWAAALCFRIGVTKRAGGPLYGYSHCWCCCRAPRHC